MTIDLIRRLDSKKLDDDDDDVFVFCFFSDFIYLINFFYTKTMFLHDGDVADMMIKLIMQCTESGKKT